MESRRLLAYIESLPEDERKRYKSLIDDALRRDQELSLAAYEANRQAELYEMQSKRLQETTAQFHVSVGRLNDKLAALAGMTETAFREASFGASPAGHSTLKH